MVDKIVRNDSGIPEAYILKPNPVYHRGRPKIESITARFFGSDEKLIEAFNAGEIESIAGIDQSKLSALKINPATHTIVRIPLPRTFALFINQNKSPALRDKGARTALDTAINRTSLIESVLGGYGRALYSPVPEGFGVKTPTSTPQTEGTTFDAARAILKDAGWKLNSETDIWEKQIDGTLTPLSFSISTVNNPVFEATAEFIQSTWEKLGAKVTIKQFEQSDLTQSIIRPRDYETLLFGAHVGRSLDFYSFWHSSQRNDPGLNVSLYANITTDSILSKVRTNRNDDERKASLEQFQEEIKKETPAIFFYQPELLYIFPTKVKDATFTGVGELQERFATLGSWYINTESIWPLFKNYFN
jgi:peptide/nickel transport system substrate-binding protein